MGGGGLLMVRSGAGELDTGLRELPKRAGRVALFDDLERLAFARAEFCGLFEDGRVDGTKRCGWAVVLTGDHVGIFPQRDDTCDRSAARDSDGYEQ